MTSSAKPERSSSQVMRLTNPCKSDLSAENRRRRHRRRDGRLNVADDGKGPERERKQDRDGGRRAKGLVVHVFAIAINADQCPDEDEGNRQSDDARSAVRLNDCAPHAAKQAGKPMRAQTGGALALPPRRVQPNLAPDQ